MERSTKRASTFKSKSTLDKKVKSTSKSSDRSDKFVGTMVKYLNLEKVGRLSWSLDGNFILVPSKSKLEEILYPEFKINRCETFIKQIGNWGFKRVIKNPQFDDCWRVFTHESVTKSTTLTQLKEIKYRDNKSRSREKQITKNQRVASTQSLKSNSRNIEVEGIEDILVEVADHQVERKPGKEVYHQWQVDVIIEDQEFEQAEDKIKNGDESDYEEEELSEAGSSNDLDYTSPPSTSTPYSLPITSIPENVSLSTEQLVPNSFETRVQERLIAGGGDWSDGCTRDTSFTISNYTTNNSVVDADSTTPELFFNSHERNCLYSVSPNNFYLTSPVHPSIISSFSTYSEYDSTSIEDTPDTPTTESERFSDSPQFFIHSSSQSSVSSRPITPVSSLSQLSSERSTLSKEHIFRLQLVNEKKMLPMKRGCSELFPGII